MSDQEIDALEEEVPGVALAALRDASEAAKDSDIPRVVVIGDGLYRVNRSGAKELIRMLPSRVTAEELLSGRDA